MSQAKILLTDDDRLILYSLAKCLRNAGYSVMEADSGESAIELCHKQSPDLAILDIRMNGISGITVAEWLNKNKPTPFIFLSAYDDHDNVQTASAAGALGYLVKPVDADRLLPTVHTALARGKEISELEKNRRQLNDTLNCSREISVAIGILMERLHICQQDAFEHIRSISRSQRRKTQEIAAEIIGSHTAH